MGGLVIITLAFVAGFLIIFAVNLVLADLFHDDQSEMKKRMEDELRQLQRDRAHEDVRSMMDLSEMAQEAYQETARGAEGFREKLKAMLGQSGLDVSVGRMISFTVGFYLLFAILAGFLSGNLIVAGIAGIFGVPLPILFVQFKRQQRLESMRSQLPDCFDLMGRIIRAGQTMSQAMQAVTQEFQPPISSEFGLCYEQQNLGLSQEFAMRDLARRTGLLEIKIFVLAVLVHRQTGGNLTELLDKLSVIVRDRYRIRAKIKGLTAEGRLQGLILLALPVGVYGILLVLNRPYAIKLFDHPWLPIITLTMMSIGAVWIRKIVNFDF